MSLNVAIGRKDDLAYLFAASVSPNGRPVLQDIKTLELEQPQAVEGEGEEEAAEEQNPEATVNKIDLEEVFGGEILSTTALLENSRVLFENVDLPFKDEKQVEKVLPLQLQDRIPFDIEDFVIDSCLSSESDTGSYSYISSYTPRHEVDRTLKSLESVGLEPSSLTNNAFALAGLTALSPHAFPESVAIIEIQPKFASIVIIDQGGIALMRELNAKTSADVPQLMSDIKCSIENFQHGEEQKLEKILLVGSKEAAQALASSLETDSAYLDLNSLRPTNIPAVDLNEFPAALGLLGHESEVASFGENGQINFRQGEFAYKPTLGNVLVAAKQHFWSITGAFLMGIIFLLSQIFVEDSQHKNVASKLNQIATGAVPGEFVPKGGEISFLEEKVLELEDQLRDIGSLSALSPLNSLKELSEFIPESLGTEIETMVIGNSSIVINGSLASIPDLGRLDSILKKNSNKFCSVDVINRGQQGNRIKFRSEIKLCE